MEVACSIEAARTHEKARYATLQAFSTRVPYQSAAFFLCVPKTWQLTSCLIAQPVGTDLNAEVFKRCVESIVGTNAEHTHSRIVFSPSRQQADGPIPSNPIEGQTTCVCSFADDKGMLGALVLCRTPRQNPFTHKERFIVKVLEPFITRALGRFFRNNRYGLVDSETLRSQYGLTAREIEVVSHVVYGMTITDIATKLTISSGTVKKHLENIYRKMGVNNRMSLMKFAQHFVA